MEWEDYSDAEIVAAGGDHAAIEMMRRLKVVIVAQEQSATSLGNRIWWLNFWLLFFTIAICALTAILVWKELAP